MINTGIFVIPSFEEALPLLGNEKRLYEMCCNAPGGKLTLLIGGEDFYLDKPTMDALRKLMLEQKF